MTDAVYERASQYFLLREFSNALDALTAEHVPSVKADLLYLALCDRAFVEPNSADWPLNDSGRKQLRRSVDKSHIWDELQASWGTEPVPPEVILNGLKISSKYKSDPAPIIAFIETYLSQHALPQNVLLTFVIDILVRLQHDFYYARELVKSQLIYDDEAMQQKILTLIDEEEAEYFTEVREEAEKLQRLESERVKLAIEQELQRQQKETEKEREDLSSVNGDSSEEDIHKIVPRSYSVENRRGRQVHRQHMSLVQLWKQWLREFLRSQGLFNALIFIFLLLAMASNRRMRVILDRGGRWAWQSIKTSLKMGLSVTYF